MKTTIKSLFALCFLLCSGTVLAQDHVLTYAQISRPVNATVNIAGEPHTMVKIPVRDLISGSMYSVIYPAPTEAGLFTTGIVTTLHNSDTFVPNITIDTFPAQVLVIDGLNYILSSDGLGGYDFIVTGSATVSVSIDLGDTIMSVSNTLLAKDNQSGLPFLTNEAIGPSANAEPFAQWGRYVDQTGLVNALDKWIDHIRIIPE